MSKADDRIRVRETRILADDHFVLRKTVFDYRRRDGTWQTLSRETYDRGNGAAVLPYDPARATVLLVRQLRYAAYASGHEEPLIEAIAGVLDGNEPETTVRKEAEEEAGFRLRAVRHAFDVFTSPGAVTERLSLYTAEYALQDRVSAGGGLAAEGEDIELLELPFREALSMAADGSILDAKTILLLQHIRLAGLL